MSTNPAVAGRILRNFAIISTTALAGVFATNEIMGIANRKEMIEGVRGGLREHLGVYNASVHPEQDRLDTILDRTREMNKAKKLRPWNMTMAERAQAAEEKTRVARRE